MQTQGAVMKRRERRELPAGVLRAVRKAEMDALEHARKTIKGEVFDVGTGQTILKLEQRPLAALYEAQKISNTEAIAAQEIEQAVFAIHSGGRLAGMSLDRVDGGGRSGDSPWPAHLAKLVKTYQSWANHWSKARDRTGNPMLEVIFSAVIDERPFYIIAQEANCSRRRAERAVICGLRHYAAWGGYVSGRQATAWIASAEDVFSRRA
jgi:hypothetical protein